MKKITQFKRKNSLSKTIRMRLIPEGKTEENLNKKLLIEVDEERAENYKKVKEYIDEYHRAFIDDVLSVVELEGLGEYADIYYASSKNAAMAKKMEELEKDLRRQIAKAFTSDARYVKLFKADMIKELLPGYFENEEQRQILAQFNDFTTYFSSFSIIRENMYSAEAKSGAIAHRTIGENLPKFLDNCKAFERIKMALSDALKEMENNFNELLPISLAGMFEVRAFNLVLSQEGITLYNNIIGGYVNEQGIKVKGINEYIDLYNQRKKTRERLPLLKCLYKQILSEGSGISFIPEQIKEDQVVLDGINEFYRGFKDTIDKIEKLFNEFESYDLDNVYVRNDLSVTTISKHVFGDGNAVVNGWTVAYDSNSSVRNKETEKYIEKRRRAYKKIKSFSLKGLMFCGERAAEPLINVSSYFTESVQACCEKIKACYEEAKELITTPYETSLKLSKDENAIEKIKNLLDSIKELESLMKMLRGTGKESEKDEAFYGEFLPLYESVTMVDLLYDKVRNYVTKRPYSKDKIKLNFENPQLLGGWDRNKERDYRTVMLRKDGDYYLAIMDRSNSKIFLDCPYEEGEESFEKMEYKLLPGPNKMLPKVFFAKSNEDIFAPSTEILQIRKKESFKKGANFSIEDCHKMIDFYKQSIEKHEDWKKFNFSFKETNQYNDIGEFFKDVKEQGYSISFKNISKAYIDEMVDKGALYLFRIYNKDFSKSSKGTPNLHTMYFRMLFDERNLKDVVYQLNGGAEMFYRKASLKKEKPEHPAGKPIDNKNPDNPKKQSVFKFDLYKDKRFMENQYFLHLPITINFKAENVFNINYEVRKAIKNCESNYVIGINRGERHLIYVSVIDSNGDIVEQYSLNEIVNKGNGTEHKTDYYELLQAKEMERLKARQDWTTIENIRDLKEGYLSQVVHKICELVIKYDAIVAMEDLNDGFKNSGKKLEKDIYQKLENMLTEKLAYLVDKKIPINENGGLLNGYQLTNKSGNLDKPKQDGFIMYVPVWFTSNIDPVTGFANLFKLKSGMTLDAMGDFFSRFDSIRYNEKDDLFEFEFNYDNFTGGSVSCRKKWIVCTYGDRVETYSKSDDNVDYRIINLTEEFKRLFAQCEISLEGDLKDTILNQDNEKFFSELIRLYMLTVQMCNAKIDDIDTDYIISPVRDESGQFFDSRKYSIYDDGTKIPQNIDANGAYNIARKALYAVEVIKATEDIFLEGAIIYPGIREWLAYVQK